METLICVKLIETDASIVLFHPILGFKLGFQIRIIKIHQNIV